MEQRELNVQLRTETGKGNARRLRETAMIPGIFYGPHMKQPVPVAISKIEFGKLRQKGQNVFITLKTEGASDVNGKVAVLKDEQFDPISGALSHVDLYEIRMDEEIKVNVAVVLTGKAKGLGDGGILQQVSREVPIRCLPAKVPQNIAVDVSDLGVGQSIHIRDVKLPDGIKIVGSVNYTIAAVVMPEEEVAAAPAVAADAVPATAQAAPAPGAEGDKAAPGAKGTEKAPAKEGEKKAEAKK